METVNKYHKSKIYKLCCKDPNISDIYIGSTISQYRRKFYHKKKSNTPDCNIKVYKFIREHGGIENWDMVVLEEYKAESKNELHWKEREWIERLKPSLNSYKPIITSEERKQGYRDRTKLWRETNKEKAKESDHKYYEKNKEMFRDRSKIYYETNKEKIKEYKNKYYEKNKKEISNKKKIYRETNKDKLKQNKFRPVFCVICKTFKPHYDISRHKKSKTHIKKAMEIIYNFCLAKLKMLIF